MGAVCALELGEDLRFHSETAPMEGLGAKQEMFRECVSMQVSAP
ncbi:hypothetical protein Q31a_39210 [Aureliella helgolandensis]|uniref:Uncharacterized protein n=1 Tax=Aureliella helgolandensis TaxID=2527968 RepID=A0A518GAH7_9BACT|nr:hypothetical protein Q31a_39210 [Aureliella helgolandensis]